MKWAEDNWKGKEVLFLKGTIDLKNSPELRTLLKGKVGARTLSLVIHFGAVDYIDSSGLAALVEYYKESRSFDGTLNLVAMTPQVRSVFELVRLDELFSIHETLDTVV